jgi:hypothetical protein
MEIDGEVPSLAQTQIYINLRYHQRYSRQSSSPTAIPGRETPLDLHFLELLQKTAPLLLTFSEITVSA